MIVLQAENGTEVAYMKQLKEMLEQRDSARDSASEHLQKLSRLQVYPHMSAACVMLNLHLIRQERLWGGWCTCFLPSRCCHCMLTASCSYIQELTFIDLSDEVSTSSPCLL